MIIDGKKIAHAIEQEVKEQINKSRKSSPPGLSFILVGTNIASKTYIQMKKKKCKEVGIRSFDYELDETISENQLLEIIKECNENPHIDGILVQLPLPNHISTSKVLNAIDPQKDVDGFHPVNMGKLLLGEKDGLIPCTPNGIIELLLRSHISIEGKHIVIVGRSNIVGKPLAALLMQKGKRGNATVTVAHSHSKNLKEICQSAQIVIAAAGSPGLITKEMISPGTVVIDVGINRAVDADQNPILVGDVDFEHVKDQCSHITPVPGGVGPMTIAMLLSNTLLTYQKNRHET